MCVVPIWGYINVKSKWGFEAERTEVSMLLIYVNKYYYVVQILKDIKCKF